MLSENPKLGSLQKDRKTPRSSVQKDCIIELSRSRMVEVEFVLALVVGQKTDVSVGYACWK